MGALDGLRVVELAGGVGVAYATKLLADLGADVLRVETERDIVRGRPHEVHRWLNTNKRSVLALDGLLDGADLLVHDLGPTAAAAAGLTYAELAARWPRLVVGSLTPFGMTGPWAEYAGTELSVIHASSWGFLSPSSATDVTLPPLKAPGHHATILTATVAATAFLAATDHAAQTGRGDHVDFSSFAAGARMTETAPALASFRGEDASRLGVKTLVPWAIYACRDGLVQFLCVEQAHWLALITLMGDPEWAKLEVFATNVDRQDNADLMHLYLSEWMAEQTVQDLYRRAQALRLCISPVYTMDQLESDAQFRDRGFLVEGADGLRLPGPGFRFDWPAWQLRSPAPAPGEHDGEGWLADPTPASAPGVTAPSGLHATEPDTGSARPLDGVRICDFTWIWAGPYCTQLLAHLGADVIRLESPEYLCLFRRLPFNPPGLPLTPDTDGLFQLYNSDKRSLAIDLRHDDAREIVRRLVADADVVIENFAVGALAGLGFGVEDLRAINPDVVVVSLSGYGQTGPSSGFMAYGPVGGAVAGLYAANGYEGGQASETGVAIGDPGTGLTAAFATVASLVCRRRTGHTSRVDVAMVEAIGATIGELWMQYVTDGVPPLPAGNRDPQWAPHGVYSTGGDSWVTIACTSDSEWQALVSAAARRPDGSTDPRFDDPRFATQSGRKTHEAEIDDLLTQWLDGRDRWEACRLLQAAGVAAMPSLAPLELWTSNEQLAAIGMLEQPHHPATGRHTVPGVPWRLANGANGLRRAAPLLGQHTDEVLAELGFSPPQVDALRSSGAIPS
ncbi:MAG: CoA transferase [Actinomycetota bacterium]|nr:CoA transferase [Actinomycetota bacterium]